MHTAILISGRNMSLIGIPFMIVLVAGIFRLDQIIAAP